MNIRKQLVIALSIALAFVGLLGCGTTNHLQTITLSAGNSAGTFNLKGIGGLLQLKATATYTSAQSKDISNLATYTMVSDPFGQYALPTPPLTAQIDSKGLITATEPAVCTWTNLNASDLTKAPAWVLDADYVVIAKFEGVTSQPVYVGVGSAAGQSKDGSCGP